MQTYKINIKLLEVNEINDFNKASKEMLSINFDIPSITNYIDPVFQFYLNHSYLLNKDNFYFNILTNLSDDIYINTWSGSIHKDKNSVVTNQTNVITQTNGTIQAPKIGDLEKNQSGK